MYRPALFLVKIYWRIFKPVTLGARIMLVTEEKVFLVQPRTLNYWNIPGGGIGKHESPEQGALRELFEETGIRSDKADYLLGTYTSSDEGKRDTVYIFIKKVREEFVAVSDIEIGQSGWFYFGELPEGTTSRTKMRIQEYLAGKRDINGLLKELHI